MLLRHRFQPDGFKLNYIDFTHKSHGPAQTARSSLSDNDLMVHFPTFAGAQLPGHDLDGSLLVGGRRDRYGQQIQSQHGGSLPGGIRHSFLHG